MNASSLDATSRVRAVSGRALVLGGGGATGNAWLIGVLAGLIRAGTDVTRPELTIGTSAGATAAAQLTGTSITQLYADTLVPVPPRPAVRRPATGPGGAVPRPLPTVDHLGRMRAVIDASADPGDFRRRWGAAALEIDDGGESSARWRAVVAGRLPGAAWPGRELAITVYDARTGEPVVFDRHSGVELVDAVAASTSNGNGAPPHHIGAGRFLDGGYRRNENADLAAGCSRVLVLSPLGGRTLRPLSWRMQLSAQLEELSAGGASVEVVLPGKTAEPLMGANAMNVAARPDAARAGHAQGLALASRLAEFWG